jgi:hypothetical protein
MMEQAEDAISDAKHSFFYIGVRRTRCFIFYKMYISHNRNLQSKLIYYDKNVSRGIYYSYIALAYTKNCEVLN